MLPNPPHPTHSHKHLPPPPPPPRRLKAETASLKEAIAARTAEAAQLVDLRDKDYDKALGKAKGKEEALSKELVKVRGVASWVVPVVCLHVVCSRTPPLSSCRAVPCR